MGFYGKPERAYTEELHDLNEAMRKHESGEQLLNEQEYEALEKRLIQLIS